jgi:hypothetical protein
MSDDGDDLPPLLFVMSRAPAEVPIHLSFCTTSKEQVAQRLEGLFAFCHVIGLYLSGVYARGVEEENDSVSLVISLCI